MRFAFSPRSLSPTREALRTSTRLPPSTARTRTTTSSLKPNQAVVAVASMRPFAGSESAISQPSARAASSARANACAGASDEVKGTISG